MPPPSKTPANIRIRLIFPEASHRATFSSLIVWVYLHSFSRGCVPKMWARAKFRENFNLVQGHRFWYQSKAHIYDFLLVINSNLCPILHRVWDTATYWLKICVFFLPLSYLASSLPMFPLEFRSEINHEETSHGATLGGESCMILTSTVFDRSTHVTDRRTDGQVIAYSVL